MRRIAAALLSVAVIVVSVRADDVRVAPRTTLLIGVVAFNPDPDQQRDASANKIDPILNAYLESVSKTAVAQGADLHFEVVRGNYYQILHWMRDGSIDGALLSPFTYHVLLADTGSISGSPGAPLALAAFPTPPLTLPDGSRVDGNTPMFRALIDKTPVDAERAEEVFDQCIDSLLSDRAGCRFAFVAHLSTTGFFYPLLKIKKHVESKPHYRRIAEVIEPLLKRTEFLLWHKRVEEEGTLLEFTYANALLKGAQEEPIASATFGAAASRQATEKDRQAKAVAYLAKTKWQPLFPHHPGFAADVLVLSGVSSRAIAVREQFPAAGSLWRPAKPLPGSSSYGYVQPLVFDSEAARMHDSLAVEIKDLFQSSSKSREIWERWYVKERYEFTPEELVDLLKNDQLLSGRQDAAIVLPGGGVRGAYQAVVLDKLYSENCLVNRDAVSPRDRKPLMISNIVGTSGGALMGYFAAHKPKGKSLTERWINQQNKVVIQPSDVFPYTGALRWLSVLAVVGIFTFWMTLLWLKPAGDANPARGVPIVLSIPMVAALLGLPLTLRRLLLNEVAGDDWWWALAYVVCLLVIHALHSVIEPSDLRRMARTRMTMVFVGAGIAALLGGAVFLGIALFTATVVPYEIAVLAGDGLLLMVIGGIVLGRRLGVRISTSLTRQYAVAMSVLAGFLAGVLLLFSIAAATHRATMVELTVDYWIWLGIAATIMSVVIVLLRNSAVVGNALTFWFRVTRAKPFFYTPMVTLLLAGVLALVSWVSFVAPALYDGDVGAKQFAKQAAELTTEPLTARFVAALTTLGTPLHGAYEPFAPGDYYATLRDSRLQTFPRLLVYDARETTAFSNAVSASGSPFPIYPGRVLKRENKIGLFIDGGYTHLVPIEGAVRLGAKQVLIVANKSDDDQPTQKEGLFGLLVSDLPRTAGFLFDRAQVVDHISQDNVMVATIAPIHRAGGQNEQNNDPPFLMDFRPATIADLVEKARHDMEGRPGQMTSWGHPTVFLVPPPKAKESSANRSGTIPLLSR